VTTFSNASFSWGTGNTLHIVQTVARCSRCDHPDAAVLQARSVIELLKDARKLTHPDVCDKAKASEVTAQLNACIDEIEAQLAAKQGTR
jgi:hypothetical protein